MVKHLETANLKAGKALLTDLAGVRSYHKRTQKTRLKSEFFNSLGY